jgi:hypothetical protein
MTAPRIRIERLAGLAGFGLPGSALSSVGEIDPLQLSGADRAAVEALFTRPRRTAVSGQTRDTFHYRLSRPTKSGVQTVDADETEIPIALIGCIKDAFRDS